MISSKDKSFIAQLALRYKAKKILLFGSSSTSAPEPHDIDLAVDGLDPKTFFKFYGELMFHLSKPVDLVDLSVKSKFTQHIKDQGILIYG